MTYTWWMPSTWWGEDLGRARRLSDYTFAHSKAPLTEKRSLNPTNLTEYKYVSCKLERPDGKKVRAKVTSDEPCNAYWLLEKLKNQIRKKYHHNA